MYELIVLLLAGAAGIAGIYRRNRFNDHPGGSGDSW